MGVEDFYGKWIKAMMAKYPNIKKNYTELKRSFSLSIDMNGMMHSITSQIYAYGDKLKENEKRERKRYIANLIRSIREKVYSQNYILKNSMREKIELDEDEIPEADPEVMCIINNLLDLNFCEYSDPRLEKIVKVQLEKILFDEFCQELSAQIAYKTRGYGVYNMLNLAVDGPAPWPKIQQQRTRRFKAAKLNPNAGELIGDEYYFNASANISPGTEFMQKLDEYLVKWIKSRTGLERAPTTIRYSSFMVRGEGEHKIISDMRNRIILPDEQNNDPNIIMGKDADLVILSCLSPLKNIVVNREQKHDNIDINALKTAILSEMNFTSKREKKHSQEYLDKICLQDFALITFFVGNDFLPRIYQFKNVKASLNLFIKTYQFTKLRLTDESYQINWDNFSQYLSKINDMTPEFLISILNDDWEHPPVVLKASIVEDELNLNFFTNMWYANALMPRDLSVGVNLYNKLFGSDLPDADDVQEMCKAYLTGLQWVLYYYNTDNVTEAYVYPYYHAPLLDEIITNIAENQVNPTIGEISQKIITMRGSHINKDIKASIPQQLAVTIPPPKNIDIIPEPVYEYVRGEGDLGSLTKYMPYNFEEEKDTIQGNKEHQVIAFIPICDPLEVTSEIKLAPRKISAQLKNMITHHETKNYPIGYRR